MFGKPRFVVTTMNFGAPLMNPYVPSFLFSSRARPGMSITRNWHSPSNGLQCGPSMNRATLASMSGGKGAFS